MTPAETKREMVRRMRGKDLPATMELIADDAVYFWSNGAAMFGKPAIEAAMKTNFDAFVGDTYDIHDVTWVAESDDVAVVLPQILRAFEGKLRAAVVSRAAEDELKARFHVLVVPSLAVTRGATPLAVIPKIKDWSDYVRIVLAALAPGAPALASGAAPKTEFSFSGKGASA